MMTDSCRYQNCDGGDDVYGLDAVAAVVVVVVDWTRPSCYLCLNQSSFPRQEKGRMRDLLGLTSSS